VDQLVHDSRLVAAKRRLNFLEKTANGVCSKLEKLMAAGAAPFRTECQSRKLSENESDCLHSVDDLLLNIEQEPMTTTLKLCKICKAVLERNALWKMNW